MPQKKNPDMAELIRGKTGRVYGSLTALLTVMKGLPLSYNTDMQEDKEATFDAVDTAKACLSVFCAMFKEVKFKTDNMKKGATGGYTNATDAADFLVRKGMAFRDAHGVAGRLVTYAAQKNTPLEALTIAELKQFSDSFDQSFYKAVVPETCLNARAVPGGPAEKAVLGQIAAAETFLQTKKRGK